MSDFKSTKQKWEELIPYLDQMEIWASRADALDADGVIKHRQTVEKNLIFPDDEKFMMYKVLRLAYKQVKSIEEGEIKLSKE